LVTGWEISRGVDSSGCGGCGGEVEGGVAADLGMEALAVVAVETERDSGGDTVVIEGVVDCGGEE
jgi:hypothetical protein